MDMKIACELLFDFYVEFSYAKLQILISEFFSELNEFIDRIGLQFSN